MLSKLAIGLRNARPLFAGVAGLVRTYKVRTSVKKFCSECYMARRKGRLHARTPGVRDRGVLLGLELEPRHPPHAHHLVHGRGEHAARPAQHHGGDRRRGGAGDVRGGQLDGRKVERRHRHAVVVAAGHDEHGVAVDGNVERLDRRLVDLLVDQQPLQPGHFLCTLRHRHKLDGTATDAEHAVAVARPVHGETPVGGRQHHVDRVEHHEPHAQHAAARVHVLHNQPEGVLLVAVVPQPHARVRVHGSQQKAGDAAVLAHLDGVEVHDPGVRVAAARPDRALQPHVLLVAQFPQIHLFAGGGADKVLAVDEMDGLEAGAVLALAPERDDAAVGGESRHAHRGVLGPGHKQVPRAGLARGYRPDFAPVQPGAQGFRRGARAGLPEMHARAACVEQPVAVAAAAPEAPLAMRPSARLAQQLDLPRLVPHEKRVGAESAQHQVAVLEIATFEKPALEPVCLQQLQLPRTPHNPVLAVLHHHERLERRRVQNLNAREGVTFEEVAPHTGLGVLLVARENSQGCKPRPHNHRARGHVHVKRAHRKFSRRFAQSALGNNARFRNFQQHQRLLQHALGQNKLPAVSRHCQHVAQHAALKPDFLLRHATILQNQQIARLVRNQHNASVKPTHQRELLKPRIRHNQLPQTAPQPQHLPAAGSSYQLRTRVVVLLDDLVTCERRARLLGDLRQRPRRADGPLAPRLGQIADRDCTVCTATEPQPQSIAHCATPDVATSVRLKHTDRLQRRAALLKPPCAARQVLRAAENTESALCLRVDAQPPNPGAMAPAGSHLLARAHIPHPDRPVVRAADEPASVGARAQPENRAHVAPQSVHHLAVVVAPHKNAVHDGPCAHQHPVGQHSETPRVQYAFLAAIARFQKPLSGHVDGYHDVVRVQTVHHGAVQRELCVLDPVANRQLIKVSFQQLLPRKYSQRPAAPHTELSRVQIWAKNTDSMDLVAGKDRPARDLPATGYLVHHQVRSLAGKQEPVHKNGQGTHGPDLAHRLH
ncbi:hypothetical protein KL939_003420 [Ogataea angusta]|nr:hypothetical protein KL939_003420 [Ogataea angusta]